MTREIVQDKLSLQVYKVWAGVLIPCTQRNGTSGSACQLTNLWKKKENRVQIEEPVNENMIISEFRKLTPKILLCRISKLFLITDLESYHCPETEKQNCPLLSKLQVVKEKVYSFGAHTLVPHILSCK